MARSILRLVFTLFYVSSTLALYITTDTSLTTTTAPFCPTVTITTTSASCPEPTNGCPVVKRQWAFDPTTITIPCDCPTKTIQTATVYSTDCSCPTDCPPSYVSALPTCLSTPSSTYPSTSTKSKGHSTTPTPSPLTTAIAKPSTITTCPTVTVSTGDFCAAFTGCITPDCILLSTIDVPCQCAGLETKTVCATGCRHGCATAFSGVTSTSCAWD